MFVAWLCPSDAPAQKLGVVDTEDIDEAMTEARRLAGRLRLNEAVCVYPPKRRPPGYKRREEARTRAGVYPFKMRPYPEMMPRAKRKRVDISDG